MPASYTITLNSMKIIGLSGTNGAGKDSVAILLAEKYGFLNISATNMLVAELNKRNWPIDRTHKSKLSAEWRREFGMAVIVDKAVDMFNSVSTKPSGLVVGSLRHPGEADRIHELGGKMVWVDADPRVRYDRIQKSLNERSGTHDEANKTFEEFLAEQEREMHPEGDEATLNMSGVRQKADLILENNGNDLEVFKNEADKALSSLF